MKISYKFITSQEKLEFLVEASSILNSSLDYEKTLSSIAKLVTPKLSDWCAIDTIEEDGSLKRVALSHIDPAKIKLAEEINEKYPPHPNASNGVRKVIDTGETEFYREIPEEMIRKTTLNEEHYRMAMDLGLRSALIVPLKARNKTFGAITLVYAESGRNYTENDIGFVEEIAGRIAIAVDNAQLHKSAVENEILFRQVAENIRDLFFVTEPATGKILFISPAFEDIWGIPVERVYEDKNVLTKFVHPDDRPNVRSSLDDLKEDYSAEYRIIRQDGGIRWLRTRAFPIFDDNGDVVRVTGVTEDITDRKTILEGITNSLKEKEILLKEIHHRVKNNLQIVSSILNLQGGFVNDPKVTEILLESKNRIRSMALIHEKLYLTNDFTKINFKSYIDDLIRNLFASYNLNPEKINIKLDIGDYLLNMDKAITVGLIINELATNTFKHAFKGKEKGEVSISLQKQGDKYHFTLIDNGHGLPAGFKLESTETLGFQLISTLVEQLEGEISYNVNSGTTFRIIFPV